MFKKFFKKKETEDTNKKTILIAALLIHAAKIDENYTNAERRIIIKSIMELESINIDKAEELINQAEKKEQESNQIVEFTKEIKKQPMEFRHKIIEILWKIVYSDRTNDMYESNLIRRVCGLLYVSDKDSGEIKLKVKSLK
tara:strand:- start:1027 stop:1449 length:423 start_codon:yes stop_codon:yes gene_type:complete